MIDKETKKKVINYLDKHSKITVDELAKIGRMSKENALKILEDLRKEKLLVVDYSDELEKTYRINKDLNFEKRDLLDELRRSF